METISVTNSNYRNDYWKKYRDTKRKSEHLENIIQALPSPIKGKVVNNVLQKQSTFNEIIAYADCDDLLLEL